MIRSNTFNCGLWLHEGTGGEFNFSYFNGYIDAVVIEHLYAHKRLYSAFAEYPERMPTEQWLDCLCEYLCEDGQVTVDLLSAVEARNG